MRRTLMDTIQTYDEDNQDYIEYLEKRVADLEAKLTEQLNERSREAREGVASTLKLVLSKTLGELK